MKRLLLPALALLTLCGPLAAADAPKAPAPPLKALLLLGGCCHDYARQKDILKAGLEQRLNVVVDIVYSEDKSTRPKLAVYGNADYAKGYDVVIHDECAADIKEVATVEGVLKPHRDGIPGVNLHCAMHCYRIGDPNKPQAAGTPEAMWFDYLGLQSSGHGPQEPIAIAFTDKAHPITKACADWKTIKEELYNNIQVLPTAHPLANGTQAFTKKKKQPDGTETDEAQEKTSVVAWTNLYMGKTRVFSTTIGHNNDTVADARYLDMVARGVLWACDKLAADGSAKPGYGPAGK